MRQRFDRNARCRSRARGRDGARRVLAAPRSRRCALLDATLDGATRAAARLLLRELAAALG
eukprot:738254-Prymnesium_polylepis.1